MPARVTFAPVTLSFSDRAIEQEFQTDSARRVQSRFKYGWSAIALAWLALGLLDRLTAGTPANVRLILTIRLAVFPVFAAVAALGWMPAAPFARWRHHASAIGCVVGIWSVIGMAAAAPDPSKLDLVTGPMGFAIGVMAACAVLASRLTVAFIAGVPATLTTGLFAARYPEGQNIAVFVWLAVATIMGGICCWRFELNQRYSFLLARSLAAERERSDALLHNLLPPAIARRLKAAPRRIADDFETASILFCDIVGFTAMSQTVDPAALVAALDEIFSCFDDVADSLGLEKIKTIGDAYMVVAGVPVPRADHAEAIAEMALRIQELASTKTLPNGTPLRVRIGVHSGPVVAGVIGKKKLVYDLWGDTVNTASRMESHGVEGAIQVSAATHELLAPKYLLTSRGSIHVKGKGSMNVWLLEGRRGAEHEEAARREALRA